MDNLSFFAHLCERNSRIETTLTEGLGYLLKTRPWAQDAVVELLAQRSGTKLKGRLDCQPQFTFDDGARPDLALVNTIDRSIHALLELKINAILTPNQPDGYVNCLVRAREAGAPGGECILFVVPSERLKEIWNEVLSRLSSKAGLVVTERFCLQTENVTISVIGWQEFITALLLKCDSDLEAKGMMAIMKDKTESELTLEIPAINPTLVSDSTFASEVYSYMQLAEKINGELQKSAVQAFDSLSAHKKKCQHGYTWTGQYYDLYAIKWFWIGFLPERWAQHGISPLWMLIEAADSQDDTVSKLQPVFARMIESGDAFFDRESLQIPIRLAAQKGGDELVSEALEQISQVVLLVQLSKSRGEIATSG